MARGWHRRQQRQQAGQLEGWRQTRLLATLWVNTHRGEKDPAVSPEEFMPLPGDPPFTPPMQEEEFKATMARLAEFDTL